MHFGMKERHHTERFGWLRAAVLGTLSARVGGAGMMVGAMRVTFWGGLAMAVTAGIGWLFGAVV